MVSKQSDRAPVVLLVNSHARRGRIWFSQAKQKLIEAGFEFDRALLVSSADRMSKEIQAAQLRGVRTFIIGGGDGTLNLAARLLCQSEGTLGILPLGTGNAFARDLGIRTNVDEACRVIHEGNVAEIDLGHVGGVPFLNVATIGLSSLIARELEGAEKRWLGPFSYLGPVFRSIRLLRPFRSHIQSEGVDDSFDCIQVVIGNGRFHAGPFKIAEDAGLQTGQLIVYALASAEKLSLLRYVWNLLRGTVEQMTEIKSYRMASGKLDTVPHKRLTIDGERGGYTPVEFGLMPGALKVFAPAQLPGEDP